MRVFFRLEYRNADDTEALTLKIGNLTEENQALRDEVKTLKKEKSAVEKRLNQQINK